jgi:hypothetical protein
MSDIKPYGKKPPLDLLPYEALQAIARAFESGARKYGRHNWREQVASSEWRREYTAAMLRHVNQYADPDYSDLDSESKLHSIAHACACGMIILALETSAPAEPEQELFDGWTWERICDEWVAVEPLTGRVIGPDSEVESTTDMMTKLAVLLANQEEA